MAEYFYYRLWDSQLSLDEKRQFVGKRAQQVMHLACNDPGWYAVTQDKLSFHMVAAACRCRIFWPLYTRRGLFRACRRS
jgi:hypothetical protein